MSWLNSLQRIVYHPGGESQMGEDEILIYIFANIGTTNKYFIDIGAGYYGNGIMSNTNKLKKQGWKGLQIDANNDNDPEIIKEYVTPKNILPMLRYYEVPDRVDLLSIDIDSFDLDIMEKIVPVYEPRVICTEINGTLNPNKSIKLKYEPGYVWDKTNKYGYSYGAAVKFCERYDYDIIFNHKNQNLFLVSKISLAATLGKYELPYIEAKQVFYHPVNPKAEWVEY